MNSLYVEALATMTEPATAKQIHALAVKMFGKQVRGGVESVRSSMARYIKLGLVERKGRGLYYATTAAVDPVTALLTKIRALETEVEQLKEKLRLNNS